MDRNPHIRKWLAVGIILLFVGTCITPAIAQDTEKLLPTSRGTWLYVGGSGPGNYSRIQDAIDNASDGDTVFVYSGLYNEGEITTGKTISLIGQDKYSTIVNSPGFINSFELNNVNINGFTIQGARTGIFSPSGNIIVFNNIIQNNTGGFWSNGDASVIYENVVVHNLNYGIHVHGSDNQVYSNDVRSNGIGIEVYSGEYGGVGTKIYENNIYDNEIDATFENYMCEIILKLIKWKNNYYGKTLFGPKCIKGTALIYAGIVFLQDITFEFIYKPVPWFKFDWHPAQEPYDIPGMS
jgi:parallel beta-helix repeat protein